MDQKITSEIIKSLPEDAADTTSDFIRASMLLGWDSTRHLFGKMIDYIFLIKAKKDAKNIENEIQAELDRIVLAYTDAKFADDPLYQRWVKRK